MLEKKDVKECAESWWQTHHSENPLEAIRSMVLPPFSSPCCPGFRVSSFFGSTHTSISFKDAGRFGGRSVEAGHLLEFSHERKLTFLSRGAKAVCRLFALFQIGTNQVSQIVC